MREISEVFYVITEDEVTQAVHLSQPVYTTKKGSFLYVNYTSVKRNYISKNETLRYQRVPFILVVVCLPFFGLQI